MSDYSGFLYYTVLVAMLTVPAVSLKMRPPRPARARRRRPPRQGTNTLYRFYGRPLYTGITNNPMRRFAEHARSKPWWPGVTDIVVENYSSRDELAAAERAAIQSEQPYYNIVHNRRRYR